MFWRIVCAAGLILMAFAAAGGALAAPAGDVARRFDFGPPAAVQPGYVAVDAAARFSAQRGYGWLDTAGLDMRDRQKPDALRRDFVLGKSPHTFRVAGLTPGRYLLTVVCGDMDYGDHTVQIKVAGDTVSLPLFAPASAEFVTLTATVNATKTLDITFDSPQNNWIVNALSLEPATAARVPVVTRQQIEQEPLKSTWLPIFSGPDPTKPLLERFRQNSAGDKTPPDFYPTGLKRGDYLKLIAGEIDFWKKYQNADGAIIIMRVRPLSLDMGI